MLTSAKSEAAEVSFAITNRLRRSADFIPIYAHHQRCTA